MASRADALSFLNGRLDAAYTQAQRLTTDTLQGYGPAIDAALLMVGAPSDELTTYDVPSADVLSYQAALKFQAWDLVLNDLAMMVDQQVDAPLTNIKASQAYKQAKERRAEALGDLNAFGIGPSTINWIRWNLDHLEPGESTTQEW